MSKALIHRSICCAAQDFLPSSLEGSLMAENQKEKVYLGTFSITTGEKTLTIDLPGQ